ncbi:hypothetical protein VN12_14680 [Pirellula sp. SH-Sr6A]|nr:hypothetical protein VN12_14680 [Pirellula sp. SH-Sr6A]
MKDNSIPARYKRSIIIATILFCMSASILCACQVPVFRYALERWVPEKYPVVVITKAPCSSREKQNWLGDRSLRLDDQLQIQWKCESDLRRPEELESWERTSPKGAGTVLTYYPEKSELRGKIASALPLKEDTFERVLKSKARREIASRLASGESAVWVVVTSGIPEKDTAAVKAIETQLKLDEKWLKLPTPEEMEIKSETLNSVKIKLKVAFSVLSISRDDPQERFLVDCLLNSEEDLRDFAEPIAFPVFGRGLVLYALVGKGINSETIRAASSFICGPCSCQVKEQNPGFDLLLEGSWDDALGDVLISQAISAEETQPTLLQIPPGRRK